MRKYICILTVLGCMLVVSTVSAKIYWLPDFLGKNMDRNAGGRDSDSDIKCPSGWFSASAASGQVCSKKHFFSGVGWCVSGCVEPCALRTDVKHDPDYGCQKTWDDCSTKCEIPYTDNCRNRTDNLSVDYGCQKYWDDCPAKCETPITDACLSQNCNDLTCTYGCKTPCPNCAAKCNECVEACDALTDNATEYGCEKYYADCPSKCERGKTCAYKDCSGYDLNSAPANSQYETCVRGCDDTTVHYRFVKCNIGYYHKTKFICQNKQLCTWSVK